MKLTPRKLFFILLILGLFVMTLYPIVDPDFWWHLRTGQLIVQIQSIPRTDPYSFTNIGRPWITHEWLSEVVLFWLFQLGSYGLLIFTFSLIITGAFLFSYLRSPIETRPFVAGFTLLLCAIASAPTWGVRLQMISLLLTSVFLFLLDQYQIKNTINFLIPLPLIMLVWVNLHAGYILGLAIIAIYIGGSFIDFIFIRIRKTESEHAPVIRPILMLFSALGLCAITALANPNGFKILIYPFQTLTSQAMQQFIQEWFSPDFHQLEWQPFAWIILALIGCGMLGKKGFSPTKILLTLIFGYSALRSIRIIPLFAVVVIPILAEQIGAIIKVKPNIKPLSWFFKWSAPILVVFAFFAATLHFSQIVQGQQNSEEANFPKAATNWISINQPKGNLFNSYNWGGYIIWRLYPQYHVYIDGRADVYGDIFINNYVNIYRAKPGWEQTFDSYSINLVLIDPGSPLAIALEQSLGWKMVYKDDLSIVFEKY
jgi:hypothetical protein